MPHAVHTRDLGRNRSWRKATVRLLARAVLLGEKIKTTHARAREAQRVVEQLITLGKRGTLPARRRALSVLADTDGVRRLFAEVAPRFKSRSGGYTRIIRDGFRAGDAARMAWLELTEKAPEERPKEAKKGKAPSKPPPETKRAPEKPKERPAAPAEKKKPPSFFEGLRKLFKRKDNPSGS